GELGMLDFAVDLGEGFFSAHGEDRMAQTNEDGDDAGEVGELHAIEPAHGIGTQLDVARRRDGRQGGVADQNGVDAPGDQDHDHDGGDLHDAHGLLAGFVDALNVVPPEIGRAHDGEARGADTRRNVQAEMDVIGSFVDEADDVLARGDATDGARQDVIEHQGGDAEFGQRAAHGFLDHAVDAAAHEHAAAFDVDGAHGIGKQHDAEDEPRCGLADVGFRFATGVIGRGSEVVEYDGCGAPEGNEAQQR